MGAEETLRERVREHLAGGGKIVILKMPGASQDGRLTEVGCRQAWGAASLIQQVLPEDLRRQDIYYDSEDPVAEQMARITKSVLDQVGVLPSDDLRAGVEAWHMLEWISRPTNWKVLIGETSAGNGVGSAEVLTPGDMVFHFVSHDRRTIQSAKISWQVGQE